MSHAKYQDHELISNWLLRDYWAPNTACLVLLNAYYYDMHSLYELTSGKQLHYAASFSALSEQDAKKKLEFWHQDLVGRWNSSQHDDSYRMGSQYKRDYCIKWALSKKVDIPWLEWAIKNGNVPADIREPLRIEADTVSIPTSSKKDPSDLEQQNRLRLIGTMLDILTNKNRTGGFTSNNALIAYINSHYEGMGLSESVLKETFAKARILTTKKI